jgi:hypothetical protein
VISRVCLYILYNVDYIRVIIIITNKGEKKRKNQKIKFVPCLLPWLSQLWNPIDVWWVRDQRATNFRWNITLWYQYSIALCCCAFFTLIAFSPIIDIPERSVCCVGMWSRLKSSKYVKSDLRNIWRSWENNFEQRNLIRQVVL